LSLSLIQGFNRPAIQLFAAIDFVLQQKN